MNNLSPPIPGDAGYPQLHAEDEWLVKILGKDSVHHCVRVRVCDVKIYTVLLQQLDISSYHSDMLRRWYKITDIEWVELTRSKV